MTADMDNTMGLVMLGGGVAAASLAAWSAATRRARAVRSNRETTGANASIWLHPVPTISDRLAVISSPFRAQASSDTREHLGVDLMYRRRDARDLIAAYPPGTAGGSALFFMPENIPALAASAGTVSFAGITPVGNTVIVRHPNGWATYYTHLATLAVRRGDVVVGGQMLGTIGASPDDAAHLRHLHFELWQGATRAGAIDPAPYLAAWSRNTSTRPDASSAIAASVSLAPRNATLSAYRPVGERGEPYPEWLRHLRGLSGVYVIREIDGPIVYVGSSVGRLYETLTRHFQAWRRYKGFWRGQFAEGADPGLTYPRGDVEAAIKITAPEDAHEEELRMIRRLEPRDNQLGQREPEPELADAPF